MTYCFLVDSDSSNASQTDSKSELPVGSVSASGEIALHSTYALEKLEILDDRILNKREALDAMQQLQKKDAEVIVFVRCSLRFDLSACFKE